MGDQGYFYAPTVLGAVPGDAGLRRRRSSVRSPPSPPSPPTRRPWPGPTTPSSPSSPTSTPATWTGRSPSASRSSQGGGVSTPAWSRTRRPRRWRQALRLRSRGRLRGHRRVPLHQVRRHLPRTPSLRYVTHLATVPTRTCAGTVADNGAGVGRGGSDAVEGPGARGVDPAEGTGRPSVGQRPRRRRRSDAAAGGVGPSALPDASSRAATRAARSSSVRPSRSDAVPQRVGQAGAAAPPGSPAPRPRPASSRGAQPGAVRAGPRDPPVAQRHPLVHVHRPIPPHRPSGVPSTQVLIRIMLIPPRIRVGIVARTVGGGREADGGGRGAVGGGGRAGCPQRRGRVGRDGDIGLPNRRGRPVRGRRVPAVGSLMTFNIARGAPGRRRRARRPPSGRRAGADQGGVDVACLQEVHAADAHVLSRPWAPTTASSTAPTSPGRCPRPRCGPAWSGPASWPRAPGRPAGGPAERLRHRRPDPGTAGRGRGPGLPDDRREPRVAQTVAITVGADRRPGEDHLGPVTHRRSARC